MIRSGRMKPCGQCGTEFYCLPSRDTGTPQEKKYCSNGCSLIVRTHDAVKAEAAFWSKVNKTDGCWLWTAATNEHGYGMTTWIGVKNIRAHRQSYELAFGPIPEGMQVLHKCDVRRCVRPDHFFVGTNEDNMADKVSKGRDPSAHLKPEQVRQIRTLLGTETQRDIAKLFGVKHGVVSDVALGYTYQHVK